MTDQLSIFDLGEVNSAIAGIHFHGHLHYLASTPSTNDLAHQAADAGAHHGVWIADEQTAGRGRGSHTWHSTPGDGLYMTALVSPLTAIPMQSALRLSLEVAIVVQAAIASTFDFRIPSQIDIRWPNDLLLNGKKCGGILIDTASNPATFAGPATLRYAIVGIGINVNHTTFPPDLDPIATSLRRELPDPSQALRREPLAAAILLALDTQVRHLSTDNRQLTADNCSTISTWITGKRVRVEASASDPAGHPGYTGTTAGLNPSGFLLVAGDDGQIHTVLSGGLREP
jgi:BirA family transcriptional regulator, biotin operon repressor / biotin---[acetyl-CoA-carboxylase] ligase